MTIKTLLPELGPNQIKLLERILLDEVIGKNDEYPKMLPNAGMYNPELVTRNKLRIEQRAKLAVLLGEGEV